MITVEDVELTPNPQALKFVVNETLLKRTARQYGKKEDAASDPLALGIFGLEGVVSVFYMNNFITIEKEKETGWGKIQKPLIAFLNDFELTSIPEEVEKTGMTESESEMYEKINDVIDRLVRPALANDGGGLEVLGLDGNIVKIHYQGACGSCPSAVNGTLRAIENLLRRDVNPELTVIPD